MGAPGESSQNRATGPAFQSGIEVIARKSGLTIY
jgi:hypothetical protein